ncbi:MAG: hypothetical protein Q9182_004770, partial [Xanthomendoza sp. 2 TL-2023]
ARDLGFLHVLRCWWPLGDATVTRLRVRVDVVAELLSGPAVARAKGGDGRCDDSQLDFEEPPIPIGDAAPGKVPGKGLIVQDRKVRDSRDDFIRSLSAHMASSSAQSLTGLGEDDSLQLASRKALAPLLQTQVPGRRNRAALQYPQQGQNDVGNDEDHNAGLKWSDVRFADWNAHQEQANRDFRPHKTGKGLDPFAVGVFEKHS